ncbi:MAG: hypothetical protein K1X48_06345 [Burkholderiaceae bacterium]|nr:hypothetical protein [Burkholderiaceae bacterium]
MHSFQHYFERTLNKSRFILNFILIATLSACYVVPVDPRTGQAYPISNPSHPSQGYGPVVLTPSSHPLAVPTPQAVSLSARLYPLNMQANKNGMLNAVVIDNHAGRGSFTVTYLGDTLQGEASRVDASYPSFGRIHDQVLGLNNQREFRGRRGIANAFGLKGVNVQCEYLLTGNQMGTGVCLFSDGGKYQIHFGN